MPNHIFFNIFPQGSHRNCAIWKCSTRLILVNFCFLKSSQNSLQHSANLIFVAICGGFSPFWPQIDWTIVHEHGPMCDIILLGSDWLYYLFLCVLTRAPHLAEIHGQAAYFTVFVFWSNLLCWSCWQLRCATIFMVYKQAIWHSYTTNPGHAITGDQWIPLTKGQ